jgi:hypothetical protein
MLQYTYKAGKGRPKMSKNKSKENLVKNSHYAQQGNDWERTGEYEKVNQVYVLIAGIITGIALIVMCL